MSEKYCFNLSDNKIVKILSEIYFFFMLGAFWSKRLIGATKWTLKYKFIMSFWKDTVDFFDEKLVYLLIIFIVLRAIIVKISMKKLITFTTLIVFAELARLKSGDTYILVIFLLIVAANEIDGKRIISFFTILNILLFTITIVGALSGILENQIEVGRNREYLGFNWTTTSVMLFTYFIFYYIVLKKGNITVLSFSIISLINIWLFIKTNTRFAFLISMSVLFVFFVISEFLKYLIDKKGLKVFLIFLPWLLFSFILVISIKYNENSMVMSQINSILSNRLQQCKTAFLNYDILPFGQPINWVMTMDATKDLQANYVDTAYLQFLLCYGYITIIMLLALCSYLLYRVYNKKIYSLVFVFAAILVFGLTERQLFWIEYDSFLLLLFANLDNLCDDLEKKFLYKVKREII